MYRPWGLRVLNASTRAEPVGLDIKQPHHRCLVGQGGDGQTHERCVEKSAKPQPAHRHHPGDPSTDGGLDPSGGMARGQRPPRGDRCHCLVYPGTHATAGRARAVVVVTGILAEGGRIAGLTEGALLVLMRKAGLRLETLRRDAPASLNLPSTRTPGQDRAGDAAQGPNPAREPLGQRRPGRGLCGECCAGLPGPGVSPVARGITPGPVSAQAQLFSSICRITPVAMAAST